MIQPRLFACSGPKIDEGNPLLEGRKLVNLDAVGDHPNVNIRIENVSKIFNQSPPPRLVDFLEIASYVYSADCATSRGVQWKDQGSTEAWGRDLSFVIAVRDPDFWNSADVKSRMKDLLAFLSNDTFSFTFTPLQQDRELQQYLEFGQLEKWPFYNPSRVVMFSGGLDSLAGVVEMARLGEKIVLVSHRPVSTMDSRQRKLFDALVNEFPGQLIHIPVWINKDEKLGRESTQRTRSFLYCALGVVVAESIKAAGVRFFENGTVSLNFPVADEALRARASRTTHPISLRLLGELCSSVVGRHLEVDNPYLLKTKTEIVSSLSANNSAHLIAHTCSCAHSMFKSKTRWHCGTCSQCIDRRFATLAAGLSNHDPETDYASDVFLGPRKDGYEKNMAVDYARHALELDARSPEELAALFNTEIGRAVRYESKRSEAASQIIDMHKRHGNAAARVLQEQVTAHAAEVISGAVEETSMLAMVLGGKHLAPVWRRYCNRLIDVLQAGLPVACSTHKPKNEPHLQEICDGLLKSCGHDLVREFPFMRWSSSLTKPDWYVGSLNVLIEAKYVRKKSDLRQITEDIAADITKYGDNDFRVLFLVYDPQHHVTDEKAFSAPITNRPGMQAGFVR